LFEVHVPANLESELQRHLFPADDEGGAITCHNDSHEISQ